MKKILLLSIMPIFLFLGCDIMGFVADLTTVEDEFQLIVDIPYDYFKKLGISTITITVNGSDSNTIRATQLYGSDFTQFSVNYKGDLESIRFSTGETLSGIGDFGLNPPGSITNMKSISKIVIYPLPYSNAYLGTGAYIGPRKPVFTLSDVSDTSAVITGIVKESSENLWFNLYLSEENDDPVPVRIPASQIYSGYTLALNPGRNYTVSIEALYENTRSVISSETSFTASTSGYTGDGENTLVVDIPDDYFSSLGTTTLSVSINNTVVDTIYSSEISGTYTQFIIDNIPTIESITFTSGSYTTLYDEIDDFASNPPEEVWGMSNIRKVVLYAYYNVLSHEYTGTGAYIGPRKPFITTESEDSNSVLVSTSMFESETDLGFYIYTSTDGGYTSTIINSTPISASEIYAGYTVTGLSSNTEYTISLQAEYLGLLSVISNSETFTTTYGVIPDLTPYW